MSRSERNSVSSLYFGEASLEKAQSISLAERMSEKTGTAVISEAAANYKVDGAHESELGDELRYIFESFEKCLNLRSEYMGISLQIPGVNPKDLDEWEIYRNYYLLLLLFIDFFKTSTTTTKTKI